MAITHVVDLKKLEKKETDIQDLEKQLGEIMQLLRSKQIVVASYVKEKNDLTQNISNLESSLRDQVALRERELANMKNN